MLIGLIFRKLKILSIKKNFYFSKGYYTKFYKFFLVNLYSENDQYVEAKILENNKILKEIAEFLNSKN